jgi:putative ABC transport system substrate-binding protein
MLSTHRREHGTVPLRQRGRLAGAFRPGSDMLRRSALLSLAALPLWRAPLAAAGRERLIAFVLGIPLDHPVAVARMTALRHHLTQRGWVEGRNLRFQFRIVTAEPGSLERAATEAIALAPDLIVAGSSTETAAILAATKTLPVLFTTASDPVGSGFVRSLERPDGNATGFSNNDPGMAAKWIELLKELAPSLTRIGVIFNPATAPAAGETYLDHLRRHAGDAGVSIVSAPVSDLARIDAVLGELARTAGTGLFFPPDSFTFRAARAFVAGATAHHMPAMYCYETFPLNGGLMSYTGGRSDTDEMVAGYVDLIFRGASIAELPVQFSRSFELVINERVAASLGLSIPLSLRVRAGRIIS